MELKNKVIEVLEKYKSNLDKYDECLEELNKLLPYMKENLKTVMCGVMQEGTTTEQIADVMIEEFSIRKSLHIVKSLYEHD